MTVTKKYFGTDGIRGKVGEFPIDAEFALKLGWAIGKVLSKNREKTKVIIGKDTRVSGYMFEAALEAGLSAAGVNSRILGPMPTPAIAYLTRTLRAQAGIVISASHNPYEDNGFKFFGADGCKLPDEIELAIEAEVDKSMTTVDASHLGKAKRVNDAPGRYIEFCKGTVSHHMSLHGLKIVVDCANGATYHVAPRVFIELGAKVIKLGTDPDGFNINSQCGSLHPELLQKAVVAEKADLGIAFDGDGDRVLMVDHKGELVDGDELLYIMAKDLVKQKTNKSKGIVGTQMSNLALELAIKELSLEFVRTPVGDRYVLAELIKRDWLLGGEASGHIICLDYTTTGDGIISALQVLNALNNNKQNLHEAKTELKKFPQRLINVRINGKAKPLANPKVGSAIKVANEKLGERGRVLIRASGTEPLIRVMVEGENKQDVDTIARDLAKVVEQAA